jgi:hypothetical protein
MHVSRYRGGPMRVRLAVYVGVALVTAVAGCRAPERRSSSEPCGLNDSRSISSTHIIFNPEWKSPTFLQPNREDWPSAIASRQLGEEVRYEEAVIDWQGSFRRSTERDYYRRFRSVRTGRTTR